MPRNPYRHIHKYMNLKCKFIAGVLLFACILNLSVDFWGDVHAESLGDSTALTGQAKSSIAHERTVWRLHSGVREKNDESTACSDPCHVGLCHFGHCSHVCYSSVATLRFYLASGDQFLESPHSIPTRFLEKPYRPPRLS